MTAPEVLETDKKRRGYDFSSSYLPPDPGSYDKHNCDLTSPAKTDRAPALNAAWLSLRTWPLVYKSGAPLGEGEVSEHRVGGSPSVLPASH